MSSPQVIDTAKRVAQIADFFKQQNRAKHDSAKDSALAKRDAYIADSLGSPGKWLSHVEVMERLTKINPSFLYERSKNYPDRGGIYLHDPGANADDLDFACRDRTFVTGLGWGMVAENSLPKIELDEWGEPLPKRVVKGWRDTLKVLIELRLITVPAAERSFGSGGPKWWLRLHAL